MTNWIRRTIAVALAAAALAVGVSAPAQATNYRADRTNYSVNGV